MGLYVRDLGAPRARAVVLLHGELLDGNVFDGIASRLARRWRVLVPDLPGHGRSPHARPSTPAAVRTALEKALDERGVSRAAVVGSSLGGYHALALTLARNVAVYRLVLLGAVAGLDAGARAALADLAEDVRRGLDVGRVFAERALPDAWAAAHPTPVDLDAVVRRCGETSRETIAAELDAMAGLPDLRPRLGEVVAQTLVRVGALDRNAPPELSRGIAAAIRGARLDVVPGIGHAEHLQDPDGLCASIEGFLLGDALPR